MVPQHTGGKGPHHEGHVPETRGGREWTSTGELITGRCGLITCVHVCVHNKTRGIVVLCIHVICKH